MKIAVYLIAALLAFFGLMFVVGSQGVLLRLFVGLILMIAAGVLIYLTRVQPKKEEITHIQKIDLTGVAAGMLTAFTEREDGGIDRNHQGGYSIAEISALAG